jgi:hypothetical protein
MIWKHSVWTLCWRTRNGGIHCCPESACIDTIIVRFEFPSIAIEVRWTEVAQITAVAGCVVAEGKLESDVGSEASTVPSDNILRCAC